jgi:hypothetical protein
VCPRLGNAHPGSFQCVQPVGLGGESVGLHRVIQLEETRFAPDRDPVAVVNAAARSGRFMLDAELSPK